MTCLICGATCKCRRATPGLCCGCHRHKVRRLKVFSFTPDLGLTEGVTEKAFLESIAKHQTEAEQRLLEFGQ